MDKKTFIAAIIASLLILSLVGALSLEVCEANPFTFGPYIGILSPELFNKKTYQTSIIPIEIQIETPPEYPEIIKIYCILDLNYSSNYNPQKTLSISNPQPSTYSGVASISYLGSGTLANLSYGTHNLDAYAVDVQGKIIKSSTRIFLVNTTSASPSPSLTISPSPSPTPTPAESSTLTPSLSPTQSATIEPTTTPNNPQDNFAPLAIAAGLAIAVAFVGSLVILAKRRGRK